MPKPLKEVTKQNPCPHCGKPDWCYSIDDLSVCNRDVSPADGWYQTGKTDKDGHFYYAPINDLSQKNVRQSQTRTWEYLDRFGNKLVRVVRIDPQKIIWQEYWLDTPQLAKFRTNECWVKLSGKDYDKGKCTEAEWELFNQLKQEKRQQIPIYCYQEIQKAIAQNKTIFIVEGESCADALWELGIPATTNIGGSKKWRDYHSQDLLINIGSRELLVGSSEENNPLPLIVLCPDRDTPGVEHMDRIYQHFGTAFWLYAFPQSPLWNIALPDSNGLDIADWIDELKNSYGLSNEQIKETIFHSVENQSRHFQTLNSSELQTLNLEIGTQNSELNNPLPLAPCYELFNKSMSTKSVNSSINNESQFNPNSQQLTQQFNDKQLIIELEQLIDNSPKESVLTTIFNKLSRLIGLPITEVRKLYRDLTKESDKSIELSIRQDEINQLLKLESNFFDLSKYLPIEMVNPLNQIAEILGSNSIAQLTALLPVIASLINPQTKLTLIKSSKFVARPIFYSAVVGESGSSKSPTMDIFTAPLIQHIQQKAEYNYKQAIAEYERIKADKSIEEKPPKPKPLEYYVTDATSECIAQIINDQPEKGFLMLFDELSGLIKQNNAYRGGKGADQEKILSGRDGTGWKVNRKNGDRFNNARSTYSILGAMTPDVLRQQMGSCQDESGYWARFVYASLPLKKCKFPDDETKFDIYPLLCGLYENIESLPAYQYYLCQEGSKIYQQFFDEMEELKLNEANQALRAVYSKFKRVAGEIALLLQSLHKAFYHNVDTNINTNILLESKFMVMGVELAKRYIKEIKSIYLKHEGSNEQNLSPIYSKIISLSQRKGWLKARDLKQCDRHFRNLLTIDIRRHFQDLISLGFGEVRGIGKHLEWRFNKNSVSNSELNQTQNSIELKGRMPFTPTESEHLQKRTSEFIENSEKQNLNLMSSNNVDNKISELPNYQGECHSPLHGESYSYSYIEPPINEKVVNVDTLPNLEQKTENPSQNDLVLLSALEQLKTENSKLIGKNLELTTNLSELKINFSELKNQNLELISELKELRNSVNSIMSQNQLKIKNEFIKTQQINSQSEIQNKVVNSIIENNHNENYGDELEYPISSESLSTFEPISNQDEILSSYSVNSVDKLSIENSSKNDLLSLNNSLNKYEGLYAVVPTSYVKSGILVGLKEDNGYLFGYEVETNKTIKLPLFHVIEYKQQ